MVYPDEVIVQTLHHLKLHQGEALDVGCGSGRHLKMLWDRGFIARGVDGSITARDIAVALGLPRGSITVDTFPPLRFTSGFFDLILAVNVLEHNIKLDREELLREIHRVMKPGGCFISRHVLWESYIPKGAGEMIEDRTFERENDTILHCFRKGEILEMWEGVGFKNLQVGKLSGWYPWLPWEEDSQMYVVAYKSTNRI